MLIHGSLRENLVIALAAPFFSLNALLMPWDEYVFGEIPRNVTVINIGGLYRCGTTNFHRSVATEGTMLRDIFLPSLIAKRLIGPIFDFVAPRLLVPLFDRDYHRANVDLREGEGIFLTHVGKELPPLFTSLMHDPELLFDTHDFTEADIDYVMEAIYRVAYDQGSNFHISKGFIHQYHWKYALEKYPNLKMVVMHRSIDKVLPSWSQNVLDYETFDPEFAHQFETQYLPILLKMFDQTDEMREYAKSSDRIFDLPGEMWYQINQHPELKEKLMDFLGVDEIQTRPRGETHKRKDVWKFYKKKLETGWNPRTSIPESNLGSWNTSIPESKLETFKLSTSIPESKLETFKLSTSIPESKLEACDAYACTSGHNWDTSSLIA